MPWLSLPHSFAAGDLVLIQPENTASHVQQFCQVLGLDPEQHFTLQPREPGEPPRPRRAPCVLPHAPAPSPRPRPTASHPLQVSPAPRGCPSPAPCGASCPSTWTSPVSPAAPSLNSWPVSPPTSWSGRSFGSSALHWARRSFASTAPGPAGRPWRWALAGKRAWALCCSYVWPHQPRLPCRCPPRCCATSPTQLLLSPQTTCWTCCP